MSFFKKYETSKASCSKCSLLNTCKTPKIGVVGNGSEGILIIGGAPTSMEDSSGSLRGDALLSKSLRAHKINTREDCWYTTAVQCAPPSDNKGQQELSVKTIDNCRKSVIKIIKDTEPNKIILLGSDALLFFYGNRNKKCTNIYNMNGLVFWDSIYNAWVFPLLHPDFINKKSYDVLLKAEWERSIAFAIKHTKSPLVKIWNKCHKLLDFKQAKQALTDCFKYDKTIAIDYETTGLDMYKEGHSTVSFSWANSKGSWSLPVQHPHWNRKQQKRIIHLINKILKTKKIKKIVAGINFEYPWTKQQMGVEPNNFFWDTQLATHVLDNRRGITGLKFQCFRRWGIEEYDTLSTQYIKCAKGKSFNDMLKMPIDALLEYNALDALYTYELYKEQLTEFVGNELKAYKFMHKGALAMCEMSYNGIRIKKSFYIKQKEELEIERDTLISKINDSEEAALYTKKYGKKFDYNSPKDLQKMLFKVLRLKSKKKTKTGDSVDADTLTKIGIQLTQNIVEVRKLNKMIGTYIDGFLKHTQNGMLHPSFSLSRARSFRSSSQNPNYQNIPKRDPKAKRITRSGMVPREHSVLGELDFSGAEISTSCYFHKDPTFIAYQTKGGGDMHRDASAEILNIKPEEVPKQIRQCTKGVWTFSQFYGSYYVSCAKQGWEEYPLCVDKDGNTIQIHGMDVGDWMKKQFKTLKGFENHLKKFQDKFWNDWFPVYTKWKDTICKEYQKLGYIETPFGFRFKGLMDSKQVSNYIVQGSSFHLLLYTIIIFWKECKKRGLQTLIIGQIHDSLILDIPIDELKDVHEIIEGIIPKLHEKFKWMDFPMGYDFEISKPYEQGGSFAYVEKLEL